MSSTLLKGNAIYAFKYIVIPLVAERSNLQRRELKVIQKAVRKVQLHVGHIEEL